MPSNCYLTVLHRLLVYLLNSNRVITLLVETTKMMLSKGKHPIQLLSFNFQDHL